MKHSSRPQTISWFQDHYKAGRLELRPPFQRKPVWSEKQRCALIESILLDVPIPEVYVQVTQGDDGDDGFGVVDGQQRLRSILQFIGIERNEDQEENDDNNNFALEALPSASSFRDKTFADITSETRKRFFQFEICVRFMYTDNTKEVEDVFKRLNKFAVPLKPQELRNATYHGPFAKLSEALADDEYWAVNRIVSPAAIRRMADIEMMSDLLIGFLHGPQGGAAKIIDQYYEQYEPFEDEFPDEQKVKRLFAKTLETVKHVFPNIADVSRWGNRADFYSLFVALGNLLQGNELQHNYEKNLRSRLLDFADDVNRRLENPTAKTSALSQQYARAIEKGSNDKARRTDRHEALIQIIQPVFKEKK
ncbi:MAG: DUF262 domain-containing protein [Verrucomicrobia bacterium]|nr:DUF262 domain-containing protein [Verrucomicrobiota bacterium]